MARTRGNASPAAGTPAADAPVGAQPWQAPEQPASAPEHIVELAVSISESETQGLMLTEAQGKEIVQLGYAVADPTVIDGDKVLVVLTDAGHALVDDYFGEDRSEGQNQPTLAPGTNVADSVGAVATREGIDTGIPIPTKGRRGRNGESKYRFEELQVGESFHIPVTPDNPDPAARIASSITNFRMKYAVPVSPPRMETVTQRKYKVGADGKIAKDENGKRIIESETMVERPVTVLTRDWIVASVGAEDPKGPGARVWRSK